MSRSPLLRDVRRWLAAYRAAQEGGPSASERIAMARAQARIRRQEGGISRRAVLAGLSATPFIPLLGCACNCPNDNPGGARIAILGGGIAGLNACHRLAQGGLFAEVYEASSRAGGRMYSGRDLFASAPGLVTELGGEFVDSIHEEILRLADELELPLLDTFSDADLATNYTISGVRYTEEEVIAKFAPVAAYVDAAYAMLEDGGDNLSYADDAGGFDLDNTPLSEFLKASGGDEVIYKILEAAYIGEYGRELSEQSSLNLIFLIGTTPGEFEAYGISDERYKIEGGNDQIPTRLAEMYQDRIHYGQTLTAVKKTDSGTFLLSFDGGDDREVDHVVMTLPFSVLRNIDLDVDLTEVKRKAIDELGYGTNAKLIVPFSSRFWRDQGDSGLVYVDQPFQSTWDSSQLQAGTPGTLTNYLGGIPGEEVGSDTPEAQMAAFLPQLDTLYPGASAQAGSDPHREFWPGNPYTLGSYACYLPGQWTSIGGAEGETEGTMVFAGEHTSVEYQGYMNGGAESGARAAQELLDLLIQGRPAIRRIPLASRRFPTRGKLPSLRVRRRS